MSNIDPRPALLSILRLCSEGRLPAKVRGWAASALDTAAAIYRTMDDMENNGVNVPTPGQAQALRNIDHAARAWLKKSHRE
jgi:hypothetical protein